MLGHSIIPPPWKNLTRYFGCFAANSNIRSQIVPTIENDAQELKTRTSYIPWIELLKRTFQIDISSCKKCGGSLKFISATFCHDKTSDIHGSGFTGMPPPEKTIQDSQNYDYGFDFS